MAFCTQANIESILSAAGVMFHTDDTVPYDTTNATHVADAIERAETDILAAVWESYATADLDGTNWAKWRAATLAACDLVTRRGNSAPASLAARCEQAREELELIRTGKATIPNLAKVRSQIPAMSNLRLDNRYLYGRLRVVTPISQGRKESSIARHIDQTSIHGYLAVW